MTLIKSEIEKQIDSALEKKIKGNLDLFSLPLISQYKLFCFNGLADGSLLVPNFIPADVQSRILVLKSFKIVPYYPVGAGTHQDFYVTDGATTNQELLPGNCRINRIFDVYSTGTVLSVFINGSAVQIFPTSAPIVPPFVTGNVPLDLDIDNIFYKYPNKITSFDLSVNSTIFNDLITPGTTVPMVKVFVGCYLI